jgi:polysaccharide deacetylase family protein (PEP-CTERM system associated)
MEHALSFDIEEFFHSYNFDRVITPGEWPGLSSRVEAYTHKILELLAATGRRATFFVLGWVAARHPTLIREIAGTGHEVASHGHMHRPVYRQTAGEFREDIHRAKAVLEDAVAAPVAGYRAPTYSIIRSSLWALDVLAEEGYRYDSSIFPLRHDRYGIPDAPRFPFRLANGLIEFPLSTWTRLGVRIPIAGGGYFRLLPYPVIKAAFESLQRADRPGIFYLHPWDLDPDQPAGRLPLHLRLRQTIGARRAARKLGRLLNEFQFAPVTAVLDRLLVPEAALCGSR